MTKETLTANLQKFGIVSPGLASRLYYFFTKGFELQRIFVTDYLVRLWCLAEGSFIERNYFAFQILDGDRDGQIGAADIVKINEELLLPYRLFKTFQHES